MANNVKSYLISLLNEGRRLDGRQILDYRQPLTIEYGISNTAEGSAKITLGNTVVLAGVKLEIGKPYPDTPEQGSIMVGAELLPMSNPEFEPGPPSMQAIELARIVDRGIRESKAVDFKSLCIEKGEKSWTVILDIITINDDGGLIDASALAALAALKDTKFPEYKDGVIDYKHKTNVSVELKKEPIAVTVYKVGNHFIVDPTREEEKASDSRLTITTISDGTICALQKGGDYPITDQDIARMMDIAVEKAAILRKAL